MSEQGREFYDPLAPHIAYTGTEFDPPSGIDFESSPVMREAGGQLKQLTDLNIVGIVTDTVVQIIKDVTGVDLGQLFDDIGDAIANGIATLQRIVGQILDIFNGLVVTPINNLIQGVKDWFAGLMGWKKSTTTSVQHNENNITNATTQIRSLNGSMTTTIEEVKTRAKYVDVPNNLPMWQSLNPLEDVTFPRILLDAAPKKLEGNTSFESHSALGTHRHQQLFSSAPFHDTTKDVLHLGFIRAPRARIYNKVGFIVDQVGGTPCPMYVAVYRVTDAGLEIEWTSGNVSSLIGTAKSEVRLDFTEAGGIKDVGVQGGEYLAVGILQTGTGNVRRLASVAMDPIAVPSAWALYPSKANAVFNTTAGSPPGALTQQQTSFEFDAVMWMCLGQRVDDEPPAPVTYSDSFDRPNSDALGRNWTVAKTSGGGSIGISGGSAGITDGKDGTRTALWAYPLNTDDQTVSAVIGPVKESRSSYLVLRANAGYTRGVAVRFTKEEVQLRRLTGVNTFADIGPSVAVSLRDGDRVELRVRNWTYTIRINGAGVYTWQDSATTKVTQRGQQYRFIGMSMYRNLWVSSTELRSWAAADIPLPQTITLAMNKIGNMPPYTGDPNNSFIRGWRAAPATRTKILDDAYLLIPSAGVIKGVEGVVSIASTYQAIQANIYGPPGLIATSLPTSGTAGVAVTELDMRVQAGDVFEMLVHYVVPGTSAERTILGDPAGEKTHLKVWFQPDEELPEWTPPSYPGPDTFPGSDVYPQEG